MSTWELTTLHKKSAATMTFFTKGKHRICINEGFRWGTVILTTDDTNPPVIDLENPDGVNTCMIPDTEWDLESFDDGWFSELLLVEGKMSVKKLEALQELYDDDNIDGLEEDGWEDEGESEWWMYGPLQLTLQPD